MVLGFILGYHLKIAVRQLFGGGEMIQDAQIPCDLEKNPRGNSLILLY